MNRYAALVIGGLFLAACDDSGNDASQDTGDSGVATGDATEGETDTEGLSCETAPVVTYETFGRGFLASYCNGCHGAAAIDRQGAPEMVTFDDAASASEWAPRIRERVFAAEGTPAMPPAGGITPDDRDRATIWLDCYP